MQLNLFTIYYSYVTAARCWHEIIIVFLKSEPDFVQCIVEIPVTVCILPNLDKLFLVTAKQTLIGNDSLQTPLLYNAFLQMENHLQW